MHEHRSPSHSQTVQLSDTSKHSPAAVDPGFAGKDREVGNETSSHTSVLERHTADENHTGFESAKSEQPWKSRFEYRLKTASGDDFDTVTAAEFEFSKAAKGTGLALSREKDKTTVSIVILSSYICGLLQATPGYQRLPMKVTTRSITIESPYEALFHYFEDMKTKHVEQVDTISEADRNDFAALDCYLTQGPPSEIFETARQSLEAGRIPFDQLWALYKPGLLVCQMKVGAIEVLKVDNVSMTKERMGDEKVLNIFTEQITWDLRRLEFKPIEVKVVQYPYATAKSLTNLSLVPLSDMCREEPSMIDKLIKRGEKWMDLCRKKPSTMDYAGKLTPFLVGRRSPWGRPAASEEEQYEGRVIVDPDAVSKAKRFANTYTQDLAETVLTNIAGPPDTLKTLKSTIDLILSSQQLDQIYLTPHKLEALLCPGAIPVFALADQRWVLISIDQLQDVKWQSEAYDKVVIEPKQKKEELLNLTKAHALHKDGRSYDLIKGKGKGLVMLFYGPPGVGKTLTAECLSEAAQLPLYRINLGVISTHKNWELHLDQIFDCAHSWNAVLLIDEAEVVLEERSFRERDQNTWVSVFLRKLEYYQGILILTTNMINAIDEAFRSRISIAHCYQQLDEDNRKIVWTRMIDDMDETKVDKKDLHSKVSRWAKHDLNARQIRNILTTAETATFDDVTLLRAGTVELYVRQVIDFARDLTEQPKLRRQRIIQA